jgi:hypothetical protein
MKKSNQEPFEALGARLRFLREQWQQSVGEVSGTLEIDEDTLLAIESGKAMPPDELLDMLISHFLLTEDQAQDLRDLATDDAEQTTEAIVGGLEDMLMKQIVMYLPVDNRVIYTDGMNATVNDNGVVLQFLQASGSNGQQTVSRVGMSREHAEKMLKVLRETLDHHDSSNGQKMLPAPDKRKS